MDFAALRCYVGHIKQEQEKLRPGPGHGALSARLFDISMRVLRMLEACVDSGPRR